MPYTQVANLDFEDIKVALKDYLRASQILLTMTLRVGIIHADRYTRL